jgi:hypothetical protein
VYDEHKFCYFRMKYNMQMDHIDCHHDEETDCYYARDVIAVCFSGENANVQDSFVDESPKVSFRLVETHTIYRCNLQS